MVVSGVFFEVLLPAIGVALSTVQLAVPFSTILECRVQGTIGPLNPVPWVSSWVNCFGWMIYGVVINDIFIMMSVLFGTVLNFYAVTTALTLLGAHNEFKKAKEVELVGIAGITLWLVIGLIVGTKTVDNDTAQFLTGTIVLCTGIFYYTSPISTAAQVIKDRDASSLSLPMLLLNAVASGVWCLYGFVLMDPFVYGLNSFALVISIVFVVVKVVLPSTAADELKAKLEDPSIIKVGNNIKSPADGTGAFDTVIVGTVRTRAGSISGGDPMTISEQPVRIAISNDQLAQFVRANSLNNYGPTSPSPGQRPRAGTSSIMYAGRNRTGSSVPPPPPPSFLTRVRSASNAKEFVHEVVETFVPEVKYDPLELIVPLTPNVDDSSSIEGGWGGGANVLPTRRSYDPPDNNANKLSAIEEDDESRRSSVNEPTPASRLDSTGSEKTGKSTTLFSMIKSPNDKKGKDKKGGDSLRDSLL